MKQSEIILKELQNAGPVEWQPGMKLQNANGSIDVSTLGYQYAIQTTTLIRARTVDQKFYEVPIADKIPMEVGEGAWLEDIKTNLVYQAGQDFETGVMGNASSNAKVPKIDVGTAPKTQVIKTWAKGYDYSVADVNKALASNNWDLVSARMRAVKKNWDLGIQKTSFLGLKSDLTNVPGLLTQTGLSTADTTTITKNISSMSYSEFQTLVSILLEVYFANSNYTVLPDAFEMPMDDYLGLGAFVSPQFPNRSMLSYLNELFKEMTGNPNFLIYGLAYGMAANNAGYVSAGGKNRYVLYRRDPETLRVDIPVDFILPAPNTADNFMWNGVGYGQFTGCVVFREPEVMYFDHN